MKKFEFDIQNEIRFVWFGVPPSSTFQQRDKNYHLKPCARLAMAQWQAILEPYAPKSPFDGPINLCIILCWPNPSKHKKREMHPKTTRPDGDNILKSVKDIMTKLGYWHDDSQVAIETVERWTDEFPRVVIRVSPIVGAKECSEH